ncbi:histidine phosphatase family protein [Massilia sp. IC2-476]|uniref:histidine phosphatase family protein n=1 Tax=Massilia sp. IC2-476 TaxID=2887199 RepID=UPI001D10C00F|nr:histidine phosphatase family protein [Massilia sp. IC2-476]MCC2972614.1 histidine phosphatase family protein [Massilia sp. IC2-476]
MNEQRLQPGLRRRVYLMRHGSVTYFDDSGKPFLPETVSLNPAGQAQADAAGHAFRAAGVRFDRVIVSGLPRTVETANRVLAASGQEIALDTWPDLHEIRGGRLSTIPTQELRRAFTGAFEGVVEEDQRFLGGESVGEMMDRVHPAIARLRALPDWDTVLLVLHGGVNCAILSLALTGQRLFLGGLSQAAGCINALDVGNDPNDWVVRFVNYVPPGPLQPEARTTTMEQLFEQYRKGR